MTDTVATLTYVGGDSHGRTASSSRAPSRWTWTRTSERSSRGVVRPPAGGQGRGVARSHVAQATSHGGSPRSTAATILPRRPDLRGLPRGQHLRPEDMVTVLNRLEPVDVDTCVRVASGARNE